MTNVEVKKIPAAADRGLPELQRIESLIERIRKRAFEIATGRGQSLGKELDDWLQAERELCPVDGELIERDTAYEANMALAGYEPAEIHVTVTPRELLVEASHKARTSMPAGAKAGTVQWSDFGARDSYRRIEFGQDVAIDRVSATLKNGVLTVLLPKTAEPARKVAIDVAS